MLFFFFIKMFAYLPTLKNFEMFPETRHLFFWLCIYRRLSLSRSPGDQTKYFKLSVVWDSQFVTSFTLYMYTDCFTIVTTTCMYMYLETTYSSLNTLWLSCSFVTLILRRLRQKLKNVDDYLHQRTPLNSVQSLKLQRRRYVHFGYNRIHLTAWLLTISVITAGQLNVNSWLSMSLRFIGV